MNRYVAEVFGTFALVLIGCGAIVVDQSFGGVIGHQGVSLAFGLIVMAMIYAVGNISGAHLNPAVTVAFVVAGRLRGRELVPYVAAQMSGALLAALVLRWFFPAHGSLGATAPEIDLARALGLEILLTFLLMFVILNVSTGHMEKGIMAGVAVGGFVALAALVGGPLTGASMNPARSLGPALVSGTFDAWWLYVVGPVVGASLAVPTCRLVQGPDCCAPDGEREVA